MARDLSLRRTLTTTTVASVACALLVMCAAFVAYELVTFRATMVRTLSAHAGILARQSISALVFDNPESAGKTLSALAADPHVMSARLYDAKGKPFASYDRPGARASAPLPVPAAGAEGHAFEAGRLVLFHPVVFDGKTLGSVVIESDLDEMQQRLRRYAVIVLVVFGVSFVIAYATASRLQRRITGPVRALVDTAVMVSRDRDFSVRASAEAEGELGQLVRTFNHMLDQIQERDAALLKGRTELESLVEERTQDLQKEVGERRALAEELRRKNLELEEQSRNVQEATRLKSEFLANMSHELRTPLNAIVGFSELLHDGKVGSVSADQKDILQDVLTSSRHLLQLINDVLDLSKVEAGKMEFRPESVDLDRVVGEVRDILRGLSAQKRIVVTTEVERDLAPVVIDPGKLKQVLYNYLSNALKFTPEGGRVVLRARSEGRDGFRMEVEDSGPGIAPEDLGRLFVEFQQLEGGAQRTHGGTGLGLALTRRIVEAQGGHVGVRSTIGRGSVFLATLPRLSAATRAGPRPATAGLPSTGPTILVIEDDSVTRLWLAQVLAAGGYAVEQAASGQQAIDLCRVRAFDGITLDLLLPDMIGWDVLREVRAKGPNRDTPVIVATVVAEKGTGAGFAIHDYLVKPAQAEDLLASLKRAGLTPADTRPVLVVDDDAMARRLAETTLKGLGYRAVAAANGEEALRAAATEPAAAVILDLCMPQMDGFQFLERFRTTDAGRATPVIVWTAKDLTAQERAFLETSAQGVVLKREGGAQSLIEELRLHVVRRAGAGA